MKDIAFLKDKLIAHRGYFDASLGIPENSLPAFETAIKFNYAIELDIHILKDNTIVVFHDDNLKRMTGVDKSIKDFNYAELKKLNLLGTKEKIPTLEQVLKLVDGQVPLLIEFKSDGNLKLLGKEAMKLLRNYNGKYAIQSFHPACVNYFRRHHPAVPRGQLSYNYKNDKIPYLGKLILRNMFFNFITKPDFISYDIRNCNRNKILKWKQKRVVFGWTVRTKEQYEDNKDFFDNLICENMQNYI